MQLGLLTHHDPASNVGQCVPPARSGGIRLKQWRGTMLPMHRRIRSAYCKLPGSEQLHLQVSDLSFHERGHTVFDQVNSSRADPHNLGHLRHRKLSQGIKVEDLVMLWLEDRFHPLQRRG